MAITLEFEPQVTPTGTSAPLPFGQGNMQLAASGRRPVQVARFVQEPEESHEGLPDVFRIGSLNHPLLRLREPLDLRVERENEWVTVWCEPLEEIGYGHHLTAAVEDLQRTVAELYFSLQTDHDSLGSDLRRLWERVQGLITQRP